MNAYGTRVGRCELVEVWDELELVVVVVKTDWRQTAADVYILLKIYQT